MLMVTVLVLGKVGTLFDWLARCRPSPGLCRRGRQRGLHIGRGRNSEEEGFASEAKLLREGERIGDIHPIHTGELRASRSRRETLPAGR